MYSENVLRVLQHSVVLWAGNIWDPEAYNLSLLLKVSTFPFIAILHSQSERNVQIVDRIQGYLDEAQFLSRIQLCITQASAAIAHTRQEFLRRF